MHSSDSQVWIVTGASRGLGRAVVEAAVAAGHRVVATARNTASLGELVDRHPTQVETVTLDVTDADAAARAVTRTVERFGRLDVVVNNAGYADLAPIEEVALDDFRAQLDTVFLGTVYLTRAALPVLRRQGSGHIIQVASTGGRITAPGAGAYQSAKFAVVGFSGVLRQEVAPLGIRVTIAEPGAMRTDWAGSSMAVPAFDPAYDATVGATARHLRATTGHEPIDPVRVAEVLVEVAGLDEPPFHLVLGSSAVSYIAEAMRSLSEEDRRWAALGSSVDYESAPATGTPAAPPGGSR